MCVAFKFYIKHFGLPCLNVVIFRILCYRYSFVHQGIKEIIRRLNSDEDALIQTGFISMRVLRLSNVVISFYAHFKRCAISIYERCCVNKLYLLTYIKEIIDIIVLVGK